MKKLLSILMGLGLILILVGCNSQETATFTQKSTNVEFFVTYTYDKKTDTVTKIKVETKGSTENTGARKENEKLSGEIKKDGDVVSVTEKDGKLISTVEIDLTKYKLSEIKESHNVLLAGLLQSDFLIEDGDKVSFSKTKENMIKYKFKEEKK
ncbi:hypothetical protein [uncultured Granulicatella sp.]|mgnify:FL=1|uniref:hypothetical protein n=1 Tax=uncultured Granulicatella sp. TaxID=316089 RepID=UPI00260C9566|nr:hypothetical protein [uncultured Granulicatella sp.]